MTNSKELAMDAIISHRQDDILAELKQFCAQPSISAQGTGISEMVNIVSGALARRGFSVRTIPTRRSPILLAERRGKGAGTVLCYNHYDVQPPEPIDEWTTPPFEPTIRDGKMFARGVMDDKGHIVCRLAAIDAMDAVYGDTTGTVKFLIEGDEETESPDLAKVVQENAQSLSADLCLWEFGDVDDDGVSMQYLGFRGILYVELSVETAEVDAHSGIWGTLIPNAAWRLNWALSRLKDPQGMILIPGFYDQVIPPSSHDLQLLAQLPMIREEKLRELGVKSFLKKFADPVEMYQSGVFSPSCTICGFTSGYQGAGPKTIVPARASAKLDFRLIPDQDPEDILKKLRAYLNQEGFADIQIECLGMDSPARTPLDHPLVAMVVEAARDVYGRPQCILPMSGGSGPARPFIDALKVPVMTVGVGYPGSRIHAPNENIRLDDLFNGIRHTARVLARMGD
jgi:acetylornithine deacetylase/succinyl-diaminopimelate desuccinylase-like protein